MSHPVEKRAAPPCTSLDPMLENVEIGFAVCLAPDSVPSCWSSCVRQRQSGHANAASWEVGGGAGNPKQSRFMLKPGRYDEIIESDKICSSTFGFSKLKPNSYHDTGKLFKVRIFLTNQSSAALRIVCTEGGENDAFLKGCIHKGNSNKDKALS